MQLPHQVRSPVPLSPATPRVHAPSTHTHTRARTFRFEGDTKPAHLTCVKPKGVVFGRQSTSMGPSEWVNWAAFECRGLEPVRWHPTGPYCVQVEGGALYEEMGFTNDEDWCEYDEKTEASLCIGKDVAYEFVLHKEK